MSEFKKNIIEFLAHDEKNVLVIKGKWGVGKTHYWNNIVSSLNIPMKQETYSYVTLFGLRSLSQLQSNIFYNSTPLSKSDRTSSIKRNAKKLASVMKTVPQLSKYSEAVSAVEQSLVKNYLICIDDLERKNIDLSMSMILGYVSNLSELCNCKVVLLFNDDTFADKDKGELNKYREKVIDVELEYAPDSASNIEIIFNDHELLDFALKVLEPTDIKNIRIIKHIKWNLDKFLPLLEAAEEPVKQDILTSVIHLTYIHNEPSLLMKASDVSRILRYSKDKPEDEKELQLRINSFGYTEYKDYEDQIINFIVNGAMDTGRFVCDLRQLNDRQKKHNVSIESKVAWASYNDNFLSTESEVIEALSSFIDKHVELLSLREIKQITEVIKELDGGIDTQKWFDRYIRVTLESENQNAILTLKTLTKDENLLADIDVRAKSILQHHSIPDTIRKMVVNGGWRNEDIEFLSNYSEDDIYNWLTSDPSPDLMSLAREGYYLFCSASSEDPRYFFGNNYLSALKKLATRSKLDRYRVVNFFKIQESILQENEK